MWRAAGGYEVPKELRGSTIMPNRARSAKGVDCGHAAHIPLPVNRFGTRKGGRNSGERRAFYAASRISQLRKSSSAASQLDNYIRINGLRVSSNLETLTLTPARIWRGVSRAGRLSNLRS
jgi:hypothetical protein